MLNLRDSLKKEKFNRFKEKEIASALGITPLNKVLKIIELRYVIYYFILHEGNKAKTKRILNIKHYFIRGTGELL